MIEVADQFGFAHSQRNEMLQQVKTNFSDVPRVWDFLAKKTLPAKKKKLLKMTESKEEQYCAVYEEAVAQIPSNEMWRLYLQASLGLLSAEAPDQERFQKRMERVLELFPRAADLKCLDMDLFPQWMTVLTQGHDDPRKVREVCDLMVRHFPHSAEAWTKRLQCLFLSLSSPEEVVACLHKAVEALPEQVSYMCTAILETWSVWEPALLYLSATDYPDLESVIEKPCFSLCREVGMPARLWYLRWTAVTKDMAATRLLFRKWYTYKPISVDFYLEYVKQELMQDKIHMKKIRKAFEDAITDYGKTDPDLWVEYIRVENSHGDPMSAYSLGSRALLNLPKGPCQDRFLQCQSGFAVSED
ncbi:hypothetical protein ACOMHN_065010 [Nucella lapillus]